MEGIYDKLDSFLSRNCIIMGASRTHSLAVAQTASEEKVQQCVTHMNERTAALAARDWFQLERLAKRYIQDCKGVLGSEDYSWAYYHIATANIQINNATAALAASEECIDIFYANAGCHVLKVDALIKLDRFAEARTEFEIAERLVPYLIKKNEGDLSETSDPLKKRLYSAKDDFLRSQQEVLDLIRYQLYR